MTVTTRTLREAENTELPLKALESMRQIRAELDELELRAIHSARDKGASWEQIAQAMGVTRQAVQQKVSRRETSPELRLP